MNPVKVAVGLLLAFGLGFVCRLFAIPAPAPNAFFGAVLVMTVTLGYLTADRVLREPGETQVLRTPATGGGGEGASNPSVAGSDGEHSHSVDEHSAAASTPAMADAITPPRG